MSFAAHALAAQQERRRKRLLIAHLIVPEPEPQKEPEGLAASEQTHRRTRKEPARHGKGQEARDASPPKPESPSPAAAPPTPCPSQQRALAVLRQRHPTAAHLAAPASRQLGPEDPAPAPNRRWRMPLPVVLQPRPASEPSTATGTGAAAGASSLPVARPSMNPDYGAAIDEDYKALEAAEAQQSRRPKSAQSSQGLGRGARLGPSGGASAPPSRGPADPELQRTACAIQAVKAVFPGWGAGDVLRSLDDSIKSAYVMLAYSRLRHLLFDFRQQDLPATQQQQQHQLLDLGLRWEETYNRQARSDAAEATAFFQRHVGVRRAWLRTFSCGAHFAEALAELGLALHDSGVADEWISRGKGDGDNGVGRNGRSGRGEAQQDERAPEAASLFTTFVPAYHVCLWRRLQDLAEAGDVDASLVYCRAVCGVVLWQAAAGGRRLLHGDPLYLAAMCACYQAMQGHPGRLHASPCLLLEALRYGPLPPLHTLEELYVSRGLGAASGKPLSLENLQITIERMAQHPGSAAAWVSLFITSALPGVGGGTGGVKASDVAVATEFVAILSMD